MIKKREYFNELIPVLKIKLRNCEQSRVKACETKVGRVFFIEAQILIRAARFTRLRVKKERAISVETFTRGQLKTLDVVPFFPHNGWKILKLPRGTFSSFCIHAIRVCMYCINAHVSWQFSTNGYYSRLASRHLWFHEFSPGEFTSNRREITRIWKIPRRNWKLPLFRLPPREFVSKRRRKTQRSVWCARVRWQFLNLAGQTRGKWSVTMINLALSDEASFQTNWLNWRLPRFRTSSRGRIKNGEIQNLTINNRQIKH